MNWALFFAPILKVLAENLVKLIYDLIEEWARGRKEKPASEEKKDRAMNIAKAMNVDLDEDQLDAAIEMVHQATWARMRRVGKAA